MKTHWTTGNNRAFLFRIVADFILRIENKLEEQNMSQGRLARKLGLSKGRVSQILNCPGNISLLTVIKFAGALGMKVALVAYEDSDPANTKGPISSQVFEKCWEDYNKPRDLWALDEASSRVVINYTPHILRLEEIDFTSNPTMRTAKVPPGLYMDKDKIDFSQEKADGRN